MKPDELFKIYATTLIFATASVIAAAVIGLQPSEFRETEGAGSQGYVALSGAR